MDVLKPACGGRPAAAPHTRGYPVTTGSMHGLWFGRTPTAQQSGEWGTGFQWESELSQAHLSC